MQIHFQKIRSLGENALYVRFDTKTPPLDLPSLARRMCSEESGIGAPLLVCLFPSSNSVADLRAFTQNGETKVPDAAIRGAAKLLYDTRELTDSLARVTANGTAFRMRVDPIDANRVNVMMTMGQVEAISEMQEDDAPIPLIYVLAEADGYRFDYTAMAIDGEEYAVSFVEDINDPAINDVRHALSAANGGRHHIFCTLCSRDCLAVRILRRNGEDDRHCGAALATASVVALTLGLVNFNTRIRISLSGESATCIVRKDLSVLLHTSVHLLFKGVCEYDNEYDEAFEPTAPTTNLSSKAKQ